MVDKVGQVNLNVKEQDGKVRGKYEHLIILGEASQKKKAVLAKRMGFDVIPNVPIAEIFLYENAASFPTKI